MHQTEASLRSELLATDIGPRSTWTRLLDTWSRTTSALRSQHPLNRMLYVYVKTYLTDEFLRASDAMSMQHSLELRTPFLDYRLVELAMAIPRTTRCAAGPASFCSATSPRMNSRSHPAG